MSKKRLHNTSDIIEPYTFANGAFVIRTAFDCEVCIERNEEPCKSEFEITYDGQKLQICAAHMQEVLNSEGGDEGQSFLGDFFNISKS